MPFNHNTWKKRKLIDSAPASSESFFQGDARQMLIWRADQEFLCQKASQGHLPVLMKKIDLGAINFFLTTDLLLLGKHVFDPNMPEVLYFPWDLMMQGYM
jgi:hypothetical protein